MKKNKKTTINSNREILLKAAGVLLIWLAVVFCSGMLDNCYGHKKRSNNTAEIESMPKDTITIQAATHRQQKSR